MTCLTTEWVIFFRIEQIKGSIKQKTKETVGKEKDKETQ